MSSAEHVLEVAPGLIRVTLPVPFELGGVHTYVLEGRDRAVLVDCGPRMPGAVEALGAGLAALGISWDRITGLLLTHWHMDHAGNAAEVRRRSGCWVAIHEDDARENSRYHCDPDLMLGDVRFFLSLGATEEEAREMVEAPRAFEGMTEPFPVDRPLRDGQQLLLNQRSCRVVWTPGHTPGHICLWDEGAGLALVGDHVLDPITPNISFLPGAEDPLGDYRGSLQRLAGLSARRLLPAHGGPIEDPLGRIQAIQEHHQQRERAAYEAVAAGAETPAEVARVLFGDDHPPLTWRLALLEALAHIEALVAAGELDRVRYTPVRRYRPSDGGARRETG